MDIESGNHEQELKRWRDLFANTPEETQEAVDGLIQKAAYLHGLCCELQEVINLSGVIKVHPTNPGIQKQVPAVKEYARLAESYANIVNKLNGILSRNAPEEEDDDLAEFE